MIKYKVNIKKSYIDLNLMGRVRTFKANEEVHEDAYTKAYPQHFMRIGEVRGLNAYLANHVFIKDPIAEFVEKEDIRKKNRELPVLVKKIENLIDKEECISEIDKEEIEEKIEKIIEITTDEENETDVKIETEE